MLGTEEAFKAHVVIDPPVRRFTVSTATISLGGLLKLSAARELNSLKRIGL